MATPAQVEANRANAQLSTGPRSAAGLENCKHNATKFGLTGKQVVIKGEDPAAYDAFRTQLIAEYKPATEQEAMLAEEIAQNWWRRERGVRTETEMLETLGLAAAMNDRGFLNLQRYIARIEKNYTRARKDILALQKLRKELQQESFIAEVKHAFFNRSPKIGSVLPKGQPSTQNTASAPAEGSKETADIGQKAA